MTKRILVLGASGMLGHTLLRVFGASDTFSVRGTVRDISSAQGLPETLKSSLITGVSVDDFNSLTRAVQNTQPDIVVNCIGVVKQLAAAQDPLEAIPINSLFPHRVARLCEIAGARFVHISTDCVFSGRKGMYKETDTSDAGDLYGRTKYLGEVDYPNSITVRTSIIGHELNSSRGLIEWFLDQDGVVTGFCRSIFSGLPTVELAHVIRDYIVPHPNLRGVYHVSAEAITKFDLLSQVSAIYGKAIKIQEDHTIIIDRSLDSRRFREATGYEPMAWPELISLMRSFR